MGTGFSKLASYLAAFILPETGVVIILIAGGIAGSYIGELTVKKIFERIYGKDE